MKIETHLYTNITRNQQSCNHKTRFSGFAIVLISVFMIALESNNQMSIFPHCSLDLFHELYSCKCLDLQHGLQRIFDFHHWQQLSQTHICCANSRDHKLIFINFLSLLFNIPLQRTSQK